MAGGDASGAVGAPVSSVPLTDEPPGRRALLRLGRLSGVALAVGVVLSGLPAGWASGATLALLLALGLGTWLAALSLRPPRSQPLVVVLLVAAGCAGAGLVLVQPQGPGFVLAYMAIAGLGFMVARPMALGAGAVVLAAVAVAQARTSTHPLAAVLAIAMGAAFLFASSAFAVANRAASLRTRQLLEERERSRAALEEAAVLGERQRVARELHDVLAHTLSGLAVQLEAARLVAEHTGADSRLTAQIGTAQRLARDGMAGARRVVSTLRGEAVEGADDLAELVRQARATTGLDVRLRVDGVPRPLAPPVGLAVYRTAQEALTNAAKYAGPGTHVDAALAYGADEVRLTVDDDGPGGRSRMAAPDLPSGGFGLSGLAERAALADGRLAYGPREGGGWRVTLSLPAGGAGSARPARVPG